MATSEYPCWSPDNPGEQAIVNKCEASKKLLNRNLADLSDNIQMDDLWPHLIALDVLDRKMATTLKQGTNYEQVQKMISWLLKNPKWKLNAFLRALYLDSQEHIISQILKLNPEQFSETEATGSSQPTNTQSANTLPRKLREAIKVQSDFYARSMMTGHLFDLKELGIPYDINDCYVNVAAYEDGYLRDRKDIPPEKILDVDPGNPRLRTVLLSGPTGSGKSTTVRRIAYKWSKQDEAERDWDLVILLNLSTLKLSSEASAEENSKEAILQSLVGREEKDEIMNNLDNKQLRLLIITDNLDECHDQETSRMVKEMVEETHKGSTNYTMLVACRSGLCPIKEDRFDRRMKVEGFTIDDGLQYVRNFYSKCRDPPDSSLMEYIVDNKDQLDHILMSPMFTHIFSVVTSNKTLTPTKGQILSKTDVLRALVKTLTERQLEKIENTQGSSQERLPDGDLESQELRFYKMCLFTLLKDVRPIKEDLLDQFGIDRKNPLLSFLEVKTSFNDKYERTVEWHFTHTVFLEYFATCALENLPENIFEPFDYLLCCDQKFRNVQRILFCSLGGKPDQVQRLSKLIQATLFLQSTLGRNISSSKSHMEKLAPLHQKQDTLKSELNISSICEMLLPAAENFETLEMPQGSDEIKHHWEEIRDLYGKDAKMPEYSDLFAIMSKDHEVMSHIFECLHEVPEVLKKLLFDNSITCLLPSKYCNESGTSQTIYATGEDRWTEIQEDKGGIYIYTSCLNDACEAIEQHSKSKAGAAGQEQTATTKRQGARNEAHQEITLAFQPDLIHLFVPASQLAAGKWKALEQLQSLQSWTELLPKLLQLDYMVNQLNIHWDRTHNISATTLLNCLLLEDTQNLLQKLVIDKDGWLDVLLQFGQIDVKDLSEWRTKYLNQKCVRIQLLKLRCNNQNPELLEGNLDAQLHNTVHGGFRLFSSLMMSNRGGSVTWFRHLPEKKSGSGKAGKGKARAMSFLKILAVGESYCGKTWLMLRFVDDDIPQRPILSTCGIDFKITRAKVDAQDCKIQLWDVAGQQRFRDTRVHYYSENMDVFLICYDVTQPISLMRISTYWYPDLRRYAPRVPIIVVGCKSDIRNHPDVTVPVTTREGQQMADKIGARGFFECSAKTGEGAQELFAAITRFALSGKLENPKCEVPSDRIVMSATEGSAHKRSCQSC